MVTGTKAELIAKQSCSAVLPKSNHPTPIFLELSGTGIFRSVPQGCVSTDHKLTQPFVCSPLSALPPAFLSLGTTVQEWVRLTRRRSKVKLTAGDLKPLRTMIDFLSHFLSFLLSSTLFNSSHFVPIYLYSLLRPLVYSLSVSLHIFMCFSLYSSFSPSLPLSPLLSLSPSLPPFLFLSVLLLSLSLPLSPLCLPLCFPSTPLFYDFLSIGNNCVLEPKQGLVNLHVGKFNLLLGDECVSFISPGNSEHIQLIVGYWASPQWSLITLLCLLLLLLHWGCYKFFLSYCPYTHHNSLPLILEHSGTGSVLRVKQSRKNILTERLEENRVSLPWLDLFNQKAEDKLSCQREQSIR